MEWCDYVFHLVAVVLVICFVDDPFMMYDVNFNGIFNVFFFVRDLGVKCVVMVGSFVVYGDLEVLLKVEIMKLKFFFFYVFHKFGGEIYGRFFIELYGMVVVIICYFNVFGVC